MLPSAFQLLLLFTPALRKVRVDFWLAGHCFCQGNRPVRVLSCCRAMGYYEPKRGKDHASRRADSGCDMGWSRHCLVGLRRAGVSALTFMTLAGLAVTLWPFSGFPGGGEGGNGGGSPGGGG